MNEDIINQAKETVTAFYRDGGNISINHVLPTVYIIQPNGEEYFFQESAASELLDSTPDYLSEKEYIIWTSQGW